MNKLIFQFFTGPSGKAVRQYFPYVSSESDLQRYRAITLLKNPSAETRTGSSISNVPSDSTKTRVSQSISISALTEFYLVFFCLQKIACIIFAHHSIKYEKTHALSMITSLLKINKNMWLYNYNNAIIILLSYYKNNNIKRLCIHEINLTQIELTLQLLKRLWE